MTYDYYRILIQYNELGGDMMVWIGGIEDYTRQRDRRPSRGKGV